MVAAPAWAAPAAELWEKWESHAPEPGVEIDYSAWQLFLARYAATDDSGINRVAYAEVSEVDRALLKAFLDRMTAMNPAALTRPQQFAYWVNLYNALTVEIVLDHYPVDSIRDINISPGLFSRGPWGKKLVRVHNTHVSLDDIEHRILRPIWRDPRIHFVVNCAAVGCPNLPLVPLRPGHLESMLERAAGDYINHPRGVTVTEDGLLVSSLFVWYADDFGGQEARVIDYLRRYARPELLQRIDENRSIADDAYDWRLNDQQAL